MHARLQRFVQDRTRMLAAISHDLRTPITSLRLRAEFIEDEEIRQKILETLEDMQRMAEATLAFAREEAAKEDTRRVDLAALVDSVCADLADMGQDVTFAGPERSPWRGRPSSLKRALSNLIENAVTYGERARVALAAGDQEWRIVIDDDGPGIPAADVERVFAPYVRLEESRNPETGGVGLGMAISRSIIRGHGGDITLANRPEGGLRITVRLPKDEG
jgi:signal transduction histidine kinase